MQTPIAAYESLRTAVLDGSPRPQGAAVLRFHGMLHGLPMLVPAAATSDTASRQRDPCADRLPAGDEFVRLLANLVLRTHSELAHVY